jgi:hypothetical protein
MKYVTKKKEVEKAKDPFRSVVTELSGLLVTSIKQNESLIRVHAAQIEKTLSGIKQNRDPVVKIIPSKRRSFHMDVNRDGKGYIKSVDGTIE